MLLHFLVFETHLASRRRIILACLQVPTEPTKKEKKYFVFYPAKMLMLMLTLMIMTMKMMMKMTMITMPMMRPYMSCPNVPLALLLAEQIQLVTFDK